MPEITADDVHAAQKAWGDGIIRIGKIYKDGGDYKAAAVEHIDNLYAYNHPKGVLFKPTLASEHPFRPTAEGAVSYKVGGLYEEDNGFALRPWTKVRFANEDLHLFGPTAMCMGHYFFTTEDGEEVKVEYTFGYIRDENGVVKINLHHSSLPYTPG